MPFQPNEHYRNRALLTEEQLRPYYGKEVAWNLEGTQIVASADDNGDIFQAVLDAGFDPEQVVFSYVPYPDQVMLGGLG
jgi:hypothetical protein